MRPRCGTWLKILHLAVMQCQLVLLLLPIDLGEQAWVPGNALVGVQESVRSSLVQHPTQAGIVQASAQRESGHSESGHNESGVRVSTM